MNDKLTLNDTIREALAVALLQLMKRKPFAQITISEIVKAAGVSRSSFYRNFDSKEQMLCDYIYGLYRAFFYQERVPQRVSDGVTARQFLLPRFRFIREHGEIFTVLSRHGLLYYFFEQTEADLIVLLCGQGEEMSPYWRAMCSGACAGVVRRWIENDFRESEEVLTDLFGDFER